ALTRELDQKTRGSTQFAVLVMREEDKPAARRHFATPLLFSIHEAKGLEYENIVLYRFVSDHRAEFAEIVEGVALVSEDADVLEYRRARDKSDKSLEVYKFFVNALYVALTRAVRNLYLIESDTGHPLFGLLDLAPAGAMHVQAQAATLQDWQKEARKLELQGKQEQADAIRTGILKQKPVPWPVFDETLLRQTLTKVFRDQQPGGKPRQQLYEHAACHDEPMLAHWLASEAKFDAARGFAGQRAGLGRKHLVQYYAHNFKDLLRQCDQHGVDHRSPMNLTPLMAAAHAGNLPLVEALLDRGADREAVDHYGCTALHWAMREAFRDPKFARGPFAALYELVTPPSIDVRAGERLVRIDRHLSEYFLFQTCWALFKSRFSEQGRLPVCAFETAAILSAWEHLPANVVPPNRRKRPYLSGLLSRNEVDRDYAYNRALFARVRQGWYQFNPQLAVRRREGVAERWVPVFEALNLPLVGEMTVDTQWAQVATYLDEGALAVPGVPIAAERWQARRLLQARELAEREGQRLAAIERAREEWAQEEVRRQEEARAREKAAAAALKKAALARDAAARLKNAARLAAAAAGSSSAQGPAKPPAPWGTPEAKRREIERIRREIEAKREGQHDERDESN
ncbi:MAG: ankyrin repeat domain-containing protein, partial [Burkholderiales bacterium]|nr:ankyrin repeat domain-containing protein [Burkholderiales bacterium]